MGYLFDSFKLEHLKINAAFFNFFEKLAPLTPAPTTPALINAGRKNNAELGPAE